MPFRLQMCRAVKNIGHCISTLYHIVTERVDGAVTRLRHAQLSRSPFLMLSSLSPRLRISAKQNGRYRRSRHSGRAFLTGSSGIRLHQSETGVFRPNFLDTSLSLPNIPRSNIYGLRAISPHRGSPPTRSSRSLPVRDSTRTGEPKLRY
ncbi:hypothetical protein K491DRAFT_216145 [Lophiostoma macrostomum CBS 122681]|uniref:Uncharacterized protein n=1 Tax=Lophiostoma macrostomum CBS 122681 TaxID=1314788 RepID=A0A6A6TGI8_9PLEO|nr:hypothetical protein K491DRAFT_216145 [Lophiostoma macrostomum CBS 122681]